MYRSVSGRADPIGASRPLNGDGRDRAFVGTKTATELAQRAQLPQERAVPYTLGVRREAGLAMLILVWMCASQLSNTGFLVE